jgi:N-acetylneuraminic acid mutarotase
MKTTRRCALQIIFPGFLLMALSACGGGGGAGATYAVGGAVSGLGADQSLVLQNNGGDNLPVDSNGAFTFAIQIASGSEYAVTVLTQPTGESCVVTAGSGAMPANNVSAVRVSCTAVWTWVSGAKTAQAAGVYGTLGVGSTANVPGARALSTSWTDGVGNLWLFGGVGNDSAGTGGYLNDLWFYTPSNQHWTWAGGAETVNASGVYGALGAGSTSNMPGSRDAAISWTDSAGNLWLFGGTGYDSSGTLVALNDLWKYTLSKQQWTWVSGANTGNAIGVYGILGVGSTANAPGARFATVSWTDSEGNFWLFGGVGYDSTGTTGALNDLWKYKSSNQQWTWVSGANTGNALGVYGTLGVESTANVPGARSEAISWTDSEGNFWLFGGMIATASGLVSQYNDLWKFTPSNQQWTWVSGSNLANASGKYGALGNPSTSNAPGARVNAVSWTSSAGELWLSGGEGYDSVGTSAPLNDLWKFTPSNLQWTWVSGSNTVMASAVYGTLGSGSTCNVPGARYGATAWTDGAGNLWLFAGNGVDSSRNFGALNDLWRF